MFAWCMHVRLHRLILRSVKYRVVLHLITIIAFQSRTMNSIPGPVDNRCQSANLTCSTRLEQNKLVAEKLRCNCQALVDKTW